MKKKFGMNRFGLSRKIPEAIKRQIRQECGFGCVICGLSIWQYEHITPPFAKARSHDPNAMALLCPNCHQKVTSGRISKETVNEKRNAPCTSRIGYAYDSFDFGESMPIITLGGMLMLHCPIPVMFHGKPLLEIKKGEESGAPFRLSGDFYNSKGKISLRIVDNEWRIFTRDNWDVDITGRTITIREGLRNISLRLIMDPPHGIVVDQLNMRIKDYSFIGDRHNLTLINPFGGRMGFTKCIVDHCHVGINIPKN